LGLAHKTIQFYAIKFVQMSMSPILMLIIYNVHNLYIMYKAQDYTVILFFRTTANPVMWKTFS